MIDSPHRRLNDRWRPAVDAEVRAHIAMQVEELVRQGWDQAAAEREALRRFGDLPAIAREMDRLDQTWERRMKRMEWLTDLAREARRTLRSLFRSPGFVAVTVLVLGAGIGSTVVVADLATRVLVTPLPYESPNRLVSLWTPDENRGQQRWPTTRLDFMDFRDQLTSFESLVAYWRLDYTMAIDDVPLRVSGHRASAGLFGLLGVDLAMGRDFTVEDETLERPVAIISDRLWRRDFAGDPAILGTTVRLNDVPYTVVGVAPRAFHFPDGKTDIWTPVHLTRATANRTARFLRVAGRLAGEVTRTQAQDEFTRFTDAVAAEYPESHAGVGGWIVSLHGDLVNEVRGAILVLSAAVGLMLLLTCANVASLLLVRGVRRQGEFAVHAALGASRGRIMRSVLVESGTLAGLGGIVGVGLAVWGIEAANRFVPDAMTTTGSGGISLRLTAIAALVTGLSVLLAGLVPAIRASSMRPADALRGIGRISGGPGVRTVQAGLLAAEVAIALTVTVGAGLLAQSTRRLASESVGFVNEGLGTARVELPSARYRDRARRTGFYNTVVQHLDATPGITSSAFVTFAAMRHPGAFLGFTMPGDAGTATQADLIVFRQVTPRYFETMGIPIQAGRHFTDGDDAAAPQVIAVNEQFVRRYLEGRQPLGMEIPIPQFNLEARIVAVVGDVRQYEVAEPPRPHVYVPEAQITAFGYYSPHDLVFRTAGDPMAAIPDIRRAVAAADPLIPVFDAQPMSDAVHATVAPTADQFQLFAGLAVGAVILATLGVFVVTSFLVQTRQRELGLRTALGASPRDLVALVVRDGARAASWGVGIGLAGAALLGHAMGEQLYETGRWEPGIIAGAVALVTAALLAASLVPARRALRLDPALPLKGP